MKYLVLIPDGASDGPVDSLGGRTPLQAARTPNLDGLAERGEIGLVHNVPPGMEPGSDVANLSVFGYDPTRFYTGRAPLEAASLGVSLGENDVALRCNLVSIGGRSPLDEGAVMEDYSAGHISTVESRDIIGDFCRSEVYHRHFLPDMELHAGVGYRHLLVWKGGSDAVRMIPPHDIIGRETAPHLPEGPGSERLRNLMDLSVRYLRDHGVNARRRQGGHRTADSFWFWGAGRRPQLPPFGERTGLKGAVISAVDLVNGIGALAGLSRISVPGATGYVDTDYGAKARYALRALETYDIVFVHIEAPDEAGHQGDADLKVRAIESVDGDFLGPALAGLRRMGEHRLLVTPDHPTPVAIRTHTADPVPFLISPAGGGGQGASYDEEEAGRSGLVIAEGHRLIDRLLGGG